MQIWSLKIGCRWDCQLDFWQPTEPTSQPGTPSVLSGISSPSLWINQWLGLIEWVTEIKCKRILNLSCKRIPIAIILLQFSCIFYFHWSILELHYLNLRFQRWICTLYCKIVSLIDLGCLPVSFGMLHFYFYKIGLYSMQYHTLSSPFTLPFLEQDVGIQFFKYSFPWVRGLIPSRKYFLIFMSLVIPYYTFILLFSWANIELNETIFKTWVLVNLTHIVDQIPFFSLI